MSFQVGCMMAVGSFRSDPSISLQTLYSPVNWLSETNFLSTHTELYPLSLNASAPWFPTIPLVVFKPVFNFFPCLSWCTCIVPAITLLFLHTSATWPYSLQWVQYCSFPPYWFLHSALMCPVLWQLKHSLTCLGSVIDSLSLSVSL